MSYLARRIQKLEARLTDRSGLTPVSAAWVDYWTEKLDQAVAGEYDGKIPLAVVDHLIREAEKEEGEVPRVSYGDKTWPQGEGAM